MALDLTIPLARLKPAHLALAGAKAVTLGRMMRAGLPVPPGFVVTTVAYLRFVESVPGWPAMQTGLMKLNKIHAPELKSLCRRLQDAMASQAIFPEIMHDIDSRLAQFPKVRLWAVRSSATAEDLPQASFAGQHESFLNVPCAEITARVRQCWLSLFTPRAILYRMQNQVPSERAAMAVIVQEMIPAEQAGVLFTRDPLSRNSGRIVIEGAPGLGQQVAGGRVTPDRVVLSRTSRRILARTPGGSSERKSTRGLPGNPGPATTQSVAQCMALEDRTALRLADLGLRLERLLGDDLDVEWAWRRGEAFLLQARPITGKTPVRTWEDRQVWSNINGGEVAPDVMTPTTWSMIRALLGSLARSVLRLVGQDVDCTPFIGLVAGRIYFNVNVGIASIKPFSFLVGNLPNLGQALGGVDLMKEGWLDIPSEDLPDLGFSWPKFILSWPRILYDLVTHSPRRGDAWCLHLKTENDKLARIDVNAMPTPALAQFFHQLIQHGFLGWDLLYLVTQAMALPLFQKACRDWLGDPDLALGYRLFSALGGMPEAEAGLALWRLAVEAHADRPTEDALLSGENWLQVRSRLEVTEPGRQFLKAWDAFMAEHGHHCRGELELFNARWSETPDYVLGLARNYLRSIDQLNVVEKQRQLARERERLTAECLCRLKNPLKRWLFSRALRRAQKLAVNREVWKNEAVRLIVLLRRILMELGRRLCREGVLAQSDDIFFVEVAEIAAVSTGQADAGLKAAIVQRRQEYEQNLKLSPPPIVVGRFDPTSFTAAAAETCAKTLKGIPVFPGLVSGPARIILRADDHQQVLPGEILVAPFTDPAWTPYFITAAGVIMEQGGTLSHGSIVAREYGLPSVTNVGCATTSIHTGDRVQVDGNRGEVTILSRAFGPPACEGRRPEK